MARSDRDGRRRPRLPPASAPPRRLAFVYVPNGVNMAGLDAERRRASSANCPAILEPLDAFKDDVNVLSGLTLDKARANGDGPGDHARAMSAFLTGRQPRKTDGADIRVGVSADQHVANAIGDKTRFPSLELGSERGRQRRQLRLAATSCAYSSNLSWRGESTPERQGSATRRLVFDRLFGGTDPKELAEARAKRELYNKSILDFVAEDAKALGKTLGQGDQRKLDEYLTRRPRDRAADREGPEGERRPQAAAEAGHGRPDRRPEATSRSTSG